MRWPWVSREMYDNLFTALQAQQRGSSAAYNLLLDRYHALKLQGAVSPEPRQPVEAKEPDPIQYAINDKAGTNPALRFHLTRWAASEKQKNVSPEKIIDRINNWQSESDD
jgi:hypothetical protein